MENGVNHIILASERLLFRKHVLADLNDFCAMEQDADVRRYVGGYPRTREAAEQRFKNSLEQPDSDRLGMWATVLKSTGQYIGRCGIYPSFGSDDKPIAGEAALGLYIAKSFWSRGYATEAGRAFINFGFSELKLRRIVTTIQVGNDASVAVIQKLGFILIAKETGEHRSYLKFALNS